MQRTVFWKTLYLLLKLMWLTWNNKGKVVLCSWASVGISVPAFSLNIFKNQVRNLTVSCSWWCKPPPATLDVQRGPDWLCFWSHFPQSCPGGSPCFTGERRQDTSWCYSLAFILFYFLSIVNLQCCVSFRCTAKWFSYVYIYMYMISDSFPFYVTTTATAGPCCLPVSYIAVCTC